MRNFTKGLFGFIIALCFTLTAFSTPQAPTPNNDVGYSCVNQTFIPVYTIDQTTLPAPVAIHFLTAPQVKPDQLWRICNPTPLIAKNSTPIQNNQISQGIPHLYIGDIKPLFLLYSNSKQGCNNQFSQGIYSPNIGYTNPLTENAENRFIALFNEADAAFTHIYGSNLSTLNPANHNHITPVPLL